MSPSFLTSSMLASTLVSSNLFHSPQYRWETLPKMSFPLFPFPALNPTLVFHSYTPPQGVVANKRPAYLSKLVPHHSKVRVPTPSPAYFYTLFCRSSSATGVHLSSSLPQDLRTWLFLLLGFFASFIPLLRFHLLIEASPDHPDACFHSICFIVL